MKNCTYCGTNKNYKAKGLCSACYKRNRQNGTLEYQPHAGGRRPSTKLCSVARCEQKGGFDSGLCSLHYKRLWATGSLDLKGPPIRPLANPELAILIDEGRWSEVIDGIQSRCSVNENGCWIAWQVASNGYGRVTIEGKRHLLHRLIAKASSNGLDLGKEQAHHKCANRACCNPDHIQRISARENMAEMQQRNFYLFRIAELEKRVSVLEKELETVRMGG